MRLDGRQLVFVPNRGQWPERVVAFAEAGPVAVWCERDGILLDLRAPVLDAEGLPTDQARGVAVALRFEGARQTAQVRGEGRGAGRSHLLLGDDPAGWVTDVPSHERLRWEALYDGIDLRARGADGRLEYDLLVADGADLSDVVVRCEGVDDIDVRPDGRLVLHTALGVIEQAPPLLFAVEADGTRRALACETVRLDATRFGFRAEHTDGLDLVLDPILDWGTFLGGSHSDLALDLRVDADGSVVVVGSSQASSYPTTIGAYDTTFHGGKDVCVTRLLPDGSGLVFSTYLGGSQDDEAWALALLPDGAVALTGFTASANFPKSPGAYDTSFAGGSGVLHSDAFVACLEPSGSSLRFSTLLGGAGDDLGLDLAARSDGALLVVGKTGSSSFPTTLGAFDRTYGGGSLDGGDVFVSAIAADGRSLLASTLLGGLSDEIGNALVLDDEGRPTVVGWTNSFDFPTSAGAWQTSLFGGADGFVATLSADLAVLEHGSLLGGISDDNLLAVQLDAEGSLVVAGSTRSPGMPVSQNAAQAGYSGGVFFGDGFCARFSADRTSLDVLQYFGGAGDEVVTDLACALDGSVLLAGWTTSTDLPLAGEMLGAALGGTTDGFLMHLAADGTLLAGSYLGGLSSDKAYAVDLAPDGRAVLAGTTTSSSFPTTDGAFDRTFGGVAGLISDAFVVCVDVGLPGQSASLVVDLGQGLAGSTLPQIAVVGSLAVGGELQLRDAPGSAPGLIFVGLDAGSAPLLGGVLVPFPYLVVAPFVCDAFGGLDLSIPPAAPGLAPLVLFTQTWLLDAGGVQGFSASNALELHLE